MLNKIILSYLTDNNASNSQGMVADELENPATYKSWIYPLRYLLALRYLKQKEKVLAHFKANKNYPILDDDFREAMIKRLSGVQHSQFLSKKKAPIIAIPFKSYLVYPALFALLIVGAIQLNQWYQQQKIENVLANHLPYFSDLLHRKLLLTQNGNTSLVEKVSVVIDKEEQKILANLPERDGIRALMQQQLERLKDSALSSSDIMLGFKKLNTLFDQKGLPYYLTPKSFSMPCSSLIDASIEEMMMIKKLEALMSDNNPELCRTTMMTIYKVEDRKALFVKTGSTSNKKETPNNSIKIVKTGGGVLDKTVELPLFRVKRIDKVPAIDSALGLTYKDRGIGSIILMDRIKKFSEESVLPALTFQGRNYIIPYWMQGYYEIEEAVTKGYKKDLQEIFKDKAELKKVKTVIKKIIKNNKARLQNSKMQQTLERQTAPSATNIFGNGLDAISVLLGKANKTTNHKKSKPKTNDEIKDIELLDKIEKVLLPSIEYHEAYHQLDKKNWKQPTWVKTTFKDLSKNGINHTLEELGAYLSQLANTEQGHNIWLSKLLIFSLNPMTKGQAEYYSSGIILKALESIYLEKPLNISYEATVDEKTLIYQTLITLDKNEIKALAKRAYEAIFEREVPHLVRSKDML